MYQRIRDLREDSDLSQKRVGIILSCSQRVYSNYERGELDIPTSVLIGLADLYETSVDYILGRTDVKKAYPAPGARRTRRRKKSDDKTDGKFYDVAEGYKKIDSAGGKKAAEAPTPALTDSDKDR